MGPCSVNAASWFALPKPWLTWAGRSKRTTMPRPGVARPHPRFDQMNQLVGASEADPDLGHRPLAGLDLVGLGDRDTPDDPEHIYPCTASVAQ